MIRAKQFLSLFKVAFFLPLLSWGTPLIYINQVAFDSRAPKIGIIQTEKILPPTTTFFVINVTTSKTVFTGTLKGPQAIDEWQLPGVFYRAAFSEMTTPGKYVLALSVDGNQIRSAEFSVGENALARLTIPSILHYYRKQRANTPGEMTADHHVQLAGSDERVDMHGGWCDASGDVSKYFSHLAYANYMSPQQTPLVTWSLINTTETIPKLLTELGVKDSIVDESLWGADYMMRALSKDDYFRMIIFSYFKKDPGARRVVGLLADSKTTADYQSAFREGGGMAIASLARISKWNKNGDFTSQQYLDAAKRAFAHLLINNTKYDDDGKENIIDDYCALMAATELWIATDDAIYQKEARKRAANLTNRLSPEGYFMANAEGRPFWHASDAGLPVVSLSRYLKKENDPELRNKTLQVIKKALDYQIKVTNKVVNPFGYARQTFRFQNKIRDGFFIPHENETGWWWQGENARLGSLATAALVGGSLVNANKDGGKIDTDLALFVSQEISWILGCNPYSMCFLYQFGVNNVPYMSSNYGHGSERGGISNGITGKDGNPDGSGIDFKKTAEGNEWRWTEQWIPHAAWFLQAVTAMVETENK